jgi:hypothetical protein
MSASACGLASLVHVIANAALPLMLDAIVRPLMFAFVAVRDRDVAGAAEGLAAGLAELGAQAGGRGRALVGDELFDADVQPQQRHVVFLAQ